MIAGVNDEGGSLIKIQYFCKNGARHLFKLIPATRYLPTHLKAIIYPVIQRNEATVS